MLLLLPRRLPLLPLRALRRALLRALLRALSLLLLWPRRLLHPEGMPFGDALRGDALRGCPSGLPFGAMPFKPFCPGVHQGSIPGLSNKKFLLSNTLRQLQAEGHFKL